MSTTTGIEWTDATWNPVRGCSRVSEGCRNCYAERVAARFADPGEITIGKYPGPFAGFVHRVNGHPAWTGKVELIPDKLLEPLSWRKPKRIFVNSMSDLFHESLPDSSIDDIFAVMYMARQHTYQILTKRPERMREYMQAGGGHDARRRVQDILDPIDGDGSGHVLADELYSAWPLSNVWLGVSVEDQGTADVRIPLLLKTSAAKRFVSYEPALGMVDFNGWLGDPSESWSPGIDWVIAGGESGPGARPPAPEWFRDARDQCAAAGVPFFFKQWGEWGPTVAGGNAMKGYKYADVPVGDGSHHRMIRVGKKLAGRLLDGREWNEFPK